MIDSVASPLGYRQIADVSAAAGFANVPVGTQLVLISAETADVRWRDDGTDPTATVGMLLTAGQTISYFGPVHKLKFIDVTSGAKVNASFYGR